MRIVSIARLIAMVVGVSTLSVSAFAQGRPKQASSDGHDGDVFYLMDADDLQREFGSPYGDLLKHRPPPKRALLIRPRASFVQEMLKSVENL